VLEYNHHKTVLAIKECSSVVQHPCSMYKVLGLISSDTHVHMCEHTHTVKNMGETSSFATSMSDLEKNYLIVPNDIFHICKMEMNIHIS
jgi:hypothetical protein